jgi:hypothetical protein
LALQRQGRKRPRKTDQLMSEIVAKRLVEHLQRWASFVVMKRAASVWPCGARRRIRAVDPQRSGVVQRRRS